MTIDDIKPYAKNSKKHPDKQVKQLADIIKEVGWRQSVLVNQEGVIIAGHGRWLVWKKYGKSYGLKTIWVIDDKGITVCGEAETTPMTPEQEKAYRIADNKLAESDYEMDLMAEELKELSPEMFNLTGYDLDFLIEPDEKEDIVPEISDEPRSKLGDLYEIGNHRVLCGDSTKREDVERLMGGKKADVVFTDPPYGVNYAQGRYTGKIPRSSNNRFSIIENDDKKGIELREFLKSVWSLLKDYSKQGASFYVWSPALEEGYEILLSLQESGVRVQTQIIWNKAFLTLSRSDYHWKHENCWYGFWEGGGHTFYGDRTHTTVWEEEPSDEKLLEWIKSRMESEWNGKSTVWTVRRDKDYKHPTQKPVLLGERAFANSSKREDIILDVFLGSGSTLIAAEKTGRVCYGMELDPKYIDVAVQRWVNYTGLTEIKKNGDIIVWEKS